ncbi:hypothetical protein AB1N83_010764 [Pleurotus pulmonarius]
MPQDRQELQGQTTGRVPLTSATLPVVLAGLLACANQLDVSVTISSFFSPLGAVVSKWVSYRTTRIAQSSTSRYSGLLAVMPHVGVTRGA